jgi:hypothetical protein
MSNGLLDLLYSLPKRKIFISYHHGNDQWYYDELSRLYCHIYDLIQDNSLDRAIDSDDPEYVRRRIRENHITGTSCTIVLCGEQTPWRKYVDWEIKATLEKGHGLLGINLPTSIIVGPYAMTPARFSDDYYSGHAVWIQWNHLAPHTLTHAINLAINTSAGLINNDRAMRRRNG